MNNHADARGSRGRIMRFTALLLSGLLIGCAADVNPGSQGSEPKASEPAAKQPAPASDEPATGSAKPAKPPTEIVRTPPLQLLGMSRADIIRHLGRPAFQRRDRTALLLRYREGRCILDLFLYPHDQSGSGKAVDYIEARADDGQLIEARPCIEAVRKANASG